jgi:hypothetical protein
VASLSAARGSKEGHYYVFFKGDLQLRIPVAAVEWSKTGHRVDVKITLESAAALLETAREFGLCCSSNPKKSGKASPSRSKKRSAPKCKRSSGR